MRHKFAPANAANMTALTYYAPPPDLNSWFGPLYLFTCDDVFVEDHTRADMAQIRFMLAGQGDYRLGGAWRHSPDACLIGPTNMATPFRAEGPLRIVGVSVLPLGWAALGLNDASVIADDLRDLVALDGPAWTDARRLLLSIDDPVIAAERLFDFLRGRVTPPSASDRAFVAATDAWLADARSPHLEALQATTGLGPRQAARRCNQLFGASPKVLARKVRALRCALELAREDRAWTELAGEDFYDQSHFIREIKHFTGLTPTELRERANIVLRLTMKRGDVEGEIAPLSRIT